MGIILTIGIEIRCGMIGLGVIQAGILGVLLIDGLYLDMIDGDIIIGWAMSTMVGIVIMAGMDTTMTGTGDGE
jgi:hypothetical protein